MWNRKNTRFQRRLGSHRPSSWLGLLSLAFTVLLSTSLNVRSTMHVDLSLVLALDVSASVDAREFDLQKNGLAAAMTHPSVIEAIGVGRNKRIAVTVVQWSGYQKQFVVVPWHIVDGASSATVFAQKLLETSRVTLNGFTHIGGAIRYSVRVARSAEFTADRMVIDISGDGTNNVLPRPAGERDLAVRAGFTVNGLAIVNEASDLDQYYRRNVIGGPGSFVIVAQSYDDYAKAMIQKLIREITDQQLS
ncbi:MAG: DUF1194 domain-containing protein [Pseudomonadota bacterium]